MNETLRHYLADPETGWSIGSFGVIAEFFQDQGESHRLPPGQATEHFTLTVATDRGGLGINPQAAMRPIAYETLRRNPTNWGQAVAFCLPKEQAAGAQRQSLTPLGQDTHSLLDEHRQHHLFDMGLGLFHIDACIRTDNPELIALLEKHAGKSLLAADNPYMQAVIEHSPHRVFCSALGRAEVFQAIGREKTPEGPHTHVLPKLMASGRTHSANTPLPEGWVSCLDLYPSNPCLDTLGRTIPFQHQAHEAFQQLLQQWGLPDYLEEKQRALQALADNVAPETFQAGQGRLLKAALRIALRQTEYTAPSNRLKDWQQQFDTSPADIEATEHST